jgi:two-component sensor histidine kinase
MPNMSVHLGVYFLIVLLYFARHRVPYKVKGGLILGLFFVIGTGSFPALATAGSGVFFYLSIVVLSTLFYGFRGGFTSLVICFSGLVAALFATRAGYIDPKLDLHFYAVSTSSWIGKIASFLLLGSLCLGLMTLMQRWLTKAIEEMGEEIRERKLTESMLEKSLAEKEILLQEVHHRVKSNLQAISGLLDLHLAVGVDSKVRKAIVDSQSRIRVMAQVHEELYDSEDLASIDFSSFLTRLCHGLFKSFGVQANQVGIDLELELVHLPMDTAIPCGLIVNELVSNSLRHAFSDGRTGTIRIAFDHVGEGKYRLAVSDDGVGMAEKPDPEGSDTLGVKLVNAISGQLDAHTEWSVEKGVSFSMVFREYTEAGAEIY